MLLCSCGALSTCSTLPRPRRLHRMSGQRSGRRTVVSLNPRRRRERSTESVRTTHEVDRSENAERYQPPILLFVIHDMAGKDLHTCSIPPVNSPGPGSPYVSQSSISTQSPACQRPISTHQRHNSDGVRVRGPSCSSGILSTADDRRR